MKKATLSILAIILIIGISVTAYAAGTSKNITANYGVTVMLDGKKVEYTYPNGTKAEAFVADGVTYLPVKAIAVAVGKDVAWDSKTNTVLLTTPKSDKLQIVSYPVKANRNEDVSVKVKGKSNTEYTIKVKYASGTVSTADGLEKCTSSADGYATWVWKIGGSTKPGVGTIQISGGGENASVDFEVVG